LSIWRGTGRRAQSSFDAGGAVSSRTRVSISWIHAHRRSIEIAAVVGARPYFVQKKARTLAGRYFAQARATWDILRRERPGVVVVMQPPPVALWAVLRYARNAGAIVIGDLHSGVFLDRKWSWAAPWVLRVLRRHGAAIVPNGDLADIARAAGVTTFVSHGITTASEHDHSACVPSALEGISVPFILVPFTYAEDEPVEELLAAAALNAEITWVLTGRAPGSVRLSAPPNIHFAGFVTAEAYNTLRMHASAIFALTKRDSTMQSAGYEAMASATPLVTVGTRVLKDYFREAALYTELEPASIASSAHNILSEGEVWRARMETRRGEIISQQDAPAREISAWLAREFLRGR
jgi:glycosyltransferase involved in cell wall biosynthesis